MHCRLIYLYLHDFLYTIISRLNIYFYDLFLIQIFTWSCVEKLTHSIPFKSRLLKRKQNELKFKNCRNMRKMQKFIFKFIIIFYKWKKSTKLKNVFLNLKYEILKKSLLFKQPTCKIEYNFFNRVSNTVFFKIYMLTLEYQVLYFKSFFFFFIRMFNIAEQFYFSIK